MLNVMLQECHMGMVFFPPQATGILIVAGCTMHPHSKVHHHNGHNNAPSQRQAGCTATQQGFSEC